MTQGEAIRIAKAIDHTIKNSKSAHEFKRDLNWLKDNILGSVTSTKSKNLKEQ